MPCLSDSLSACVNAGERTGKARSAVRQPLESGEVSIARVHGSYGWEHLSGLDHVRQSSDIDVWMAVPDGAQADAAAATLQSFACERPRLDGELVFDDGAAVAWREWLAWRGGRTRALLVKRIDGSSLTHLPCSLGAIAEMPPI